MGERFRISSDTGGTFTDLIVQDDRGGVRMFKSPTIPGDPAAGLLNALGLAARSYGLPLERMLGGTELLVHGTTHAINAIVTGRTARTAFMTSEGHPDILTLREGGRADPFDHLSPFPAPYVPRRLTFEVPGRIDWCGREIRPLDKARVEEIVGGLARREVEAVAVCLLWSIANPAHELRVGEILAERLPGVAVTLSHALNPTLREYRRASSACIDASLKPVMSVYLGGVQARLRDAGFAGRLMVVTSQGAMVDASEVAAAPIKAINSGPAMAPVAGAYYTRDLDGVRDVIVADTGGTTYDVSLVRGGEIPFTRDAWIGRPHLGHLTGFPSVDVKSVGAGGGSIAWVDVGGVLHVGPQSVGANPGPACYGAQKDAATVTDAALVLDYIDPEYFLGGDIRLDRAAAADVIARTVADPLGCGLDEAAAAIIEVATENMVQAIADISVDQGLDPAAAVLVGGGGAAGLNSIYIARRLGCPVLLIPELGAALSAAGGLMSEVAAEFRAPLFLQSDRYDAAAARAALAELAEKARAFADKAAGDEKSPSLRWFVEARYPRQAWELQVPFEPEAADALECMVAAFHQAHRRVYAIDDPGSPIEVVGFVVRVSVGSASKGAALGRVSWRSGGRAGERRAVRLLGEARREVTLHRADLMERERDHSGPAIVESPFSSVVIDAASDFRLRQDGSLLIRLGDGSTQGRAGQ